MRPEINRIHWLKVAILTLLSMIVVPNASHSLVGDTDGSFGLDGTIRTYANYFDYSRLPGFFTEDEDSDYSLQTILRLMAGGRPAELLSYEIHLIQGLIYSSADFIDTIYSFPTRTRYQALDATWTQLEEEHISAKLKFDRFNMKFSFKNADLTVGRQAITFGKAYFWNPLDIFLPFEPQQLDRDYKQGVDAIRIDIPFGNFSGLNLIGAWGPKVFPESNENKTWDSSPYGSALLARVYTTLMDWDFALQGGKVYGGFQIGGGAVGEMGKLEARLETAYFWAIDSDPMPSPLLGDVFEDHLTLVVGIGRMFENSFVFELEYLYNGAGDSRNLEASFLRYLLGSSLHMDEHLTGLMLKYDILPIFTSQLVWIYSISDQSSLVQPAFFLSMSDEVELYFGATISEGERPSETNGLPPRLGSEFGTYPDHYFIALKIYF
jgi:hypothetical protein